MTVYRPRYHRAIPVLRLGPTVAAVLVLTACGSAHSGAGDRAGALPRDAAVAVRFAAPRSIEVGAAGASGEGSGLRRVTGVEALSGRVHRVAGDSLWIALTTLTTAAGRETFPLRPEIVTRIHQGPETRVEVLSSSPGAIHGIAGGMVLVTIGAFLALIVYCSQTRCLD